MTRPASTPTPAHPVKAISIRTWYDMKASVTHVEFSSSEVLPVNSSVLTLTAALPLLKAGFLSKGYRTDPPELVTLSIKTDTNGAKKGEIRLFADGKAVGTYPSRDMKKTSGVIELIKCQYDIPRAQYEQWVNAKFPVLEFKDNEGLVISDDLLAALRELSRRMVARRALTFYFGRESLTATTLNDGRVLVAGGYDGFRALKNCEMYEPATGRFATGLKMQFPRRNHTATLLKDGRVLLVGGGVDGSDTALDSAELFDPARNRFSPAGKMRDARMAHTATLLNDGRVLIVGGGGKTPLAGAEFYDPATDSFLPAGRLNRRRLGHTATVLNDGKVFVAGGVDGEALDSVELFDPGTGTSRAAEAMSEPHWEHSALRLWDGTVWINGGRTIGRHLCTQEIFSADGRRLETVECEGKPRWGHTTLALNNGTYLSIGGCRETLRTFPPPPPPKTLGEFLTFEQDPWNSDCLTADIFSKAPAFPPGYFSSADRLRIYASTHVDLFTPRRHYAAAPLTDGRWLLIGGLNDNNPALNTAEFYDPKTDEIIPWRDIVNGEK